MYRSHVTLQNDCNFWLLSKNYSYYYYCGKFACRFVELNSCPWHFILTVVDLILLLSSFRECPKHGSAYYCRRTSANRSRRTIHRPYSMCLISTTATISSDRILSTWSMHRLRIQVISSTHFLRPSQSVVGSAASSLRYFSLSVHT